MQHRLNKNLILILLFVFGMLLLTGCSHDENEDTYALAISEYEQGNYAQAASYFAALLSVDPNAGDYVAYGYCLLRTGEYPDAKKAFRNALNLEKADKNCFGKDGNGPVNARLGLAEACMQTGELDELPNIYMELSNLTSDREQRLSYIRQAVAAEQQYSANCKDEMELAVHKKSLIDLYNELILAEPDNTSYLRLRREVYGSVGRMEDWERDSRSIIATTEYSPEIWFELFEYYREENRRDDILKLADDLYLYMTGHSLSAGTDDLGTAVGVLFEAADLADEGALLDPEYFFSLAENLINIAGTRGLSDKNIEKYQIVIAERKGKLELAARLLGVYLNHYADDEEAIKELDYLTGRLGIDLK